MARLTKLGVILPLLGWLCCFLQPSGTTELNLKSLTEIELYGLYNSLAKVRFSYLEKLVSDLEVEECDLSFCHLKLIHLLLEDDITEVAEARRKARKCIKLHISKVLLKYEIFLLKKYIDNEPKCLKKLFSKGPEEPYIKSLKDLGFSLYAVEALSEKAKTLTENPVDLKSPQELGLDSEITSLRKLFSDLKSCDTGFRICAQYGMWKIIKYPGLSKEDLLVRYRRFSLLNRILSDIVSDYLTKLRRYNIEYTETQSKAAKNKILSTRKSIISIQKLHSFVFLTKVFISSDILNLEEYEKIYRTMFPHEKNGL
ncbi:hypothetical protein HWI79_503 [Cryptosporidium felis]|nr:hypothetical protein HWI79_503 [Cryptosporidium felis]